MLSDSKLPLFFWGEAINVACFIQNRVIINKLLKKTPYEVYYKTKPQVNYFKTFGYPCTLIQSLLKRKTSVILLVMPLTKPLIVSTVRKTKLILESFNVDRQELSTTDARTGADWLFDYDYFFKQFRGIFPEVNLPAPSNRIVPPIALPPGPLPENNQTELVADIQETPSVVEYVATPPSYEEVIQVAAAIEEYAAGDSDNTTSTPIDTIAVPYGEHIWDEQISQEHRVDQPDSIQLATDVLVNAPHTFHHVENLSVNLQAEPVIIVDDDYRVAQKENSWVEAMQEELLQFKKLHVWRLVKIPENKRPIGTKWVFKNKKDDKGVIIRNKARLIVQGISQREGLYYDETYAPVARLEAIRLFLAYASYMNFKVCQMDVKTAFLYGKVK
ncbi:uncharacterized protein LOC143557881 [Bidens hawaiensis]|uniref:uncharacterized protein LOC143557881 n=1 Tax=Bidens hawaiensis TaxID=980011 RepID=UPI00404AADC3